MSNKRGKSDGKTSTKETTDQSSEADSASETVCEREAAEATKAESEVADHCRCASYRLNDAVYGAFITWWHTPDIVDLVYFQGGGAQHLQGKTRVKKGFKHGEWWLSEAELRAAIAIERAGTN